MSVIATATFFSRIWSTVSACCAYFMPILTIRCVKVKRRRHRHLVIAVLPSYGNDSIPIHPWHSTQIPAVLLHPCRRHDVQTTIAVIFLPSLSRAAHPSLYSRQAGELPGLRHYSVEWSSAPRHISAVTRDFQTAPQVVSVLSVLFGHSHLTHIAFIFVDLAIIDII